MSSPKITTLIITATELLISLIEIARTAKELSDQDFDAIKRKLDEKFSHVPTYDEL